LPSGSRRALGTSSYVGPHQVGARGKQRDRTSPSVQGRRRLIGDRAAGNHGGWLGARRGLGLDLAQGKAAALEHRVNACSILIAWLERHKSMSITGAWSPALPSPISPRATCLRFMPHARSQPSIQAAIYRGLWSATREGRAACRPPSRSRVRAPAHR